MKHQFYLFITALILMACNEDYSNEIVENSESKSTLISNGSNYSDASFLTKNYNGYPVLTWVEKEGKDNYLYCSASFDNGLTFGKPIKISVTKGLSSHHESMPKIAFKSNGTAVVVFQKRIPTPENQYAGVLLYSQLLKDGNKWSVPAYLHADTSRGIGRSCLLYTSPSPRD